MKFMRAIFCVGFLLFLGCSPATMPLSPAVPHLKPDPDLSRDKVDKDGDNGVEVFKPEVDILFVVDDSGSMSGHQTNLANNINLFLNAFLQRTDIDYHIGVLNTSMPPTSNPANRVCCGILVGTPNFVDRSTPNPVSVLSNHLKVGAVGSYIEMSFAPVVAALTPPLVDGKNAGFLRPQAYLAIVFITDAEDQSPINENEFFDALLAIKGRTEKILGYGVIVPTSVTSGCARDEWTPPTRIEAFLGMLPNAGKNVFSLCDPQFGDRISQIADDLLRYVGNTIYLSRRPLEQTIRVRFGTQEIPNAYKTGWLYSPSRNALLLGDDIKWEKQPENTQLEVTYEAAVVLEP